MEYRVKVTAIPEKGFRRAGFKFTREGSEVQVNAAQLKLIKDEPLLVHQVLEEIPEEDDKPPVLNATETIKLIQVADVEALAKLAEGETRKSVMDAITKRTAELGKPE